jgi:hypothetical protein
MVFRIAVHPRIARRLRHRVHSKRRWAKALLIRAKAGGKGAAHLAFNRLWPDKRCCRWQGGCQIRQRPVGVVYVRGRFAHTRRMPILQCLASFCRAMQAALRGVDFAPRALIFPVEIFWGLT